MGDHQYEKRPYLLHKFKILSTSSKYCQVGLKIEIMNFVQETFSSGLWN